MDGSQKTAGQQDLKQLPHLGELLHGLGGVIDISIVPDEILIASITADSREVRENSLFCAVSGSATDGHRYINEAIRAGAAAVVVQQDAPFSLEQGLPVVPVIRVKDSHQALGVIAARFYANPADRMVMIGITGTNGKTTVSYLLEHALVGTGLSVGVIGTVDYRYHRKDGSVVRYPAPFTTPDPVRFHKILREMLDCGVSHVVMEVSSHALQQQRLGPVSFSVGLFTNLSRDHLDYHRTMDEYFAAKSIFFSRYLKDDATAIVMTADPEEDREAALWAGKVLALCRARSLHTIACGPSEDAGFSCPQASFGLSGMDAVISDSAGNEFFLQSRLIGRFNLDNLLVSLAALVTLGIGTLRAAELLSTAEAAPGRLQRVGLPAKPLGQPTVLVDYAHTPDALQKVLQAVTAIEHRSLFCVVGCGGDRDRGKRPLMGRIAATLGDVVIITDDNPRSEDPAAIRNEILAGIEGSGLDFQTPGWLKKRSPAESGVVEIGDRAQAIAAAVSAAGAKDIVLIAGKGHENYQITRKGRHFFDDCLAARQSGLLWDSATIVEATGGISRNDNETERFTAVSTDSRSISRSDVFLALKGDLYDGHDFIGKAINAGAGCVVYSEKSAVPKGEVCSVEVPETLKALGDLAGWRRRAIRQLQNPVVVGLTGSCGKTTVKEMTAAIFARRWPDRPDRPSGRVLKTAGNFNNLIGLPHTLLQVSAQHCAVVLEMGMNRPGEIARLAEIADPDIACIINVHGAHLEGLGTIEGVARAKGELFDKAGKNVVQVVNLDDDLVVNCAAAHDRKTIGFCVSAKGLKLNPDVWAEHIAADARGHLHFILHVRERHAPLTIQAPGLHNGANACAAAAIALAAGIGFDHIVQGLELFRSAANRMQTLVTPSGLNVLNDTYNANPASMASALKTLAALPAENRVAIIGDMLELGESSAALHEAIGRQVAEQKISYLGIVGAFSRDIKRGAIDGGMNEERIVLFTEKQRAVDWVINLVHSGRLQAADWVLVKASRGVALDTVVRQLVSQQ